MNSNRSKRDSSELNRECVVANGSRSDRSGYGICVSQLGVYMILLLRKPDIDIVLNHIDNGSRTRIRAFLDIEVSFSGKSCICRDV